MTEVSTAGFKVLHEKPTPKLCIPWAAEVSVFAAEGPDYPSRDVVQGSIDGQTWGSKKLDLGNVTETWRIIKTWKYLPRECVSLTASVKEIAEKFQLTNVQTPGAALPWMTNPSYQGTVIAAPLQRVSAQLRGKATHRRKTTPSPCKLPQSLQKYPSSNPKIRNSPQPSQEGDQHALALLLPPSYRQERGTKSRWGVFPPREQKAANIIYWTVLWTSGCCVTSELSDIRPEAACIAKSNRSCCGDFFAPAKPPFSLWRLPVKLSPQTVLPAAWPGTVQRLEQNTQISSVTPLAFDLYCSPTAGRELSLETRLVACQGRGAAGRAGL